MRKYGLDERTLILRLSAPEIRVSAQLCDYHGIFDNGCCMSKKTAAPRKLKPFVVLEQLDPPPTSRVSQFAKNYWYLCLVPLFFAVKGCEGDESTVQRDVYQTKQSCVEDWNQEALCQETGEHAGGGGHFSSGGHSYMGPAYFENDRRVAYQGNEFSPRTGNQASRPAFVRTSSASELAQSSAGRPIARGGFGRSFHFSGGG